MKTKLLFLNESAPSSPIMSSASAIREEVKEEDMTKDDEKVGKTEEEVLEEDAYDVEEEQEDDKSSRVSITGTVIWSVESVDVRDYVGGVDEDGFNPEEGEKEANGGEEEEDGEEEENPIVGVIIFGDTVKR